MSSNNQKIKLRDAINYTKYNINIKQRFVNFLESTYGSQKNRLYLFSRNETAPKLFLLNLQIPVKFNDKLYDISLLVYFPLNFPNIPPEIYFEKVGKVKINPNCTFYIDEESLKINFSLFYQWQNSFESFRGLIQELYYQFGKAFPIFNLSSKFEDINEIQGDCYFKKELCKEVELINPIVIKNRNNYDNTNNITKKMMNMNINDDNRANFDSNNNYNNNNNYQEKNDELLNPYKIKNEPPVPVFNEQKAKNALIKLLQKDLHQKINYAIKPISVSYIKLEKIKDNMNQKLKEMEKVERKKEVIMQTLSSLYKELDFTINEPKEFERPDMSNLDTALIITNKDHYMKLAKEKVSEEYILIIKKNFEKRNIDFNTAVNLIRTNSRNIFFLKYKNAHPFGS